MLKRALQRLPQRRLSSEEGLRWLWLACHAAMTCGTTRAGTCSPPAIVQLAREAGALAVLPIALSSRVGVHLFAGELADGRVADRGADAVTEATGSRLAPYGALALAALARPRSRGRRADRGQHDEAWCAGARDSG